MAITKETGAIVPGANTYVTVAEANAYLAYHATRVAWAALSDADKEAALVQAVRAMDNVNAWKGEKVQHDQPRAWPRTGVVLSGTASEWSPLQSRNGTAVPSNTVPQAVQDAQCELAALMAQSDRTADRDSDGIQSVSIGKGALAVTFNAATNPSMMGRLSPAILSDYITGSGRSGTVKVHRV